MTRDDRIEAVRSRLALGNSYAAEDALDAALADVGGLDAKHAAEKPPIEVIPMEVADG